MLSQTRIDAYHRDGYSFPHAALSTDEVAACLEGLARYEAWLGKPVNHMPEQWRSCTYAFLPWVNKLIRHPRILDIIEDILGPDIFAFTTTFFIKDAQSPTFALWHQDSPYFGLRPHEHVTCWVALTDATAEAGCMEVVPERGSARQLNHRASGLEGSINAIAQMIADDFDQTETVMMEVPAGSFSLHHTLCMHRSGPNGANYRRIGIGTSYIPAHCRTLSSVRMCIPLVRGRNSDGNFDILEPPEAELHPAALARHKEVFGRFRANFDENRAAHERAPVD
jgi:ectoine hydroxylase-related dioxygenase (phytanoyl-CoA dioxygenase family)